MSRAGNSNGGEQCRYKGVRRRRWGKWVSEIRVPGTRERLWLGSYATPEAAAVAHDTAVYFLRGGTVNAGLNFPERAAAAYRRQTAWAAAGSLSPRSVQRVASDAGMATDAQLVAARESAPSPPRTEGGQGGIGDSIGTGIGPGCASATQEEAYTYGGTHGGSSGSSSDQFVCGELSVDDMEILM